MKKNKFRNNSYSNNQGYSLNYKFDSVSPAGKCSGTALDLIKRYNDLAKEAHGNGDYVEAEVFRQYAEHYRKIVTEINERKQRFETNRELQNTTDVVPEAIANVVDTVPVQPVEPAGETSDASSLVETKAKKSFIVIEITEEVAKPERSCRSRIKKDTPPQAENA